MKQLMTVMMMQTLIPRLEDQSTKATVQALRIKRNPQAREKERLRYSGEWSFEPNSGLDWSTAAQFEDPRFQMIFEQIEEDLKNSLKGDPDPQHTTSF